MARAWANGTVWRGTLLVLERSQHVGADLEPEPFRPVLRGMLLTGGNDRWLRGPARDTATASQASEQALWWPPTKIATPYLGPYLMSRDDAQRLTTRPADAQPVERDLEQLVPR